MDPLGFIPFLHFFPEALVEELSTLSTPESMLPSSRGRRSGSAGEAQRNVARP